MLWRGLHALVVKAAPTVVTGVLGVASYEVLRKAVAKAGRPATVSITAWALRVAREAERKAETVRLTTADVIAEAAERSGSAQEAAPSAVTDEKVPSKLRRTGKTRTTEADH